MITDKSKHIFVDLDETLIYCRYVGLQAPKPEYWGIRDEDKIINLKFNPSGALNEYYISRMRPGALELLAELRKRYPVSMLTAATFDYAKANIAAHGLGFTDEQIHSREHINCKILSTAELGKFEAYLIDNLSMIQNGVKMRYLNEFNPTYIKVNNFYGRDEQEWTELKIQRILKQIEI